MDARILFFHSCHPLQRLGFTLWALILVGIGAHLAWSPSHSGTVVPVYLNAAHRWIEGKDLYTPTWPLDVYRNPPWFAATLAPLAVIPETTAEIVWRGLGAAILLWGLGSWARNGLPRTLTPGETGALFSLAAPLALPSLNNGQTNTFVIGFLLLGATAAAQARGPIAGLFLALSAGIKIYPIAAGLLLAAAFPRRILHWLLVGVLGVAASPFLFREPAYVIEQFRGQQVLVRLDDRTNADLGRAPVDLRMLLRVWFIPPTPMAYTAIRLGVAASMLFLVLRASRRTQDPRFVSALALNLSCVWMTVFGPWSEAHTYTLLGPTAAAMLVLAFAGRRQNWLVFLLAASGYILLLAPVLRDMFPKGSHFHGLGPHPIGGLFILAAIIIDCLARIAPEGSRSRTLFGFGMKQRVASRPTR